jgi:hypothetical protein
MALGVFGQVSNKQLHQAWVKLRGAGTNDGM